MTVSINSAGFNPPQLSIVRVPANFVPLFDRPGLNRTNVRDPKND